MNFTKNLQPYVIAFICAVIISTLLVTKPEFTSRQSLYFGEFVQSTNFNQLVKDMQNSFSYRLYGGSYNLGIPFSPTKETVYGTQRGSRALPFVSMLALIQKVGGIYWDRLYLLIVLLLPFIGFYYASITYIPKSNRQFLWLGACTFGANPWVMSRLATGFWQLHLAYAFLPYVFLSIIHMFTHKPISPRSELRKVILLSLFTSIIYAFQPHFLLMMSFPLSLFALISRFQKSRVSLSRVVQRLFTFGTLSVVINSYHLIPSLFYKPFHISLPGQDLTLSAVLFNGQGSRIIDALKLTPIGPLQFSTYSFTLLDYAGFSFIVSAFIYTIVVIAISRTSKNSWHKSACLWIMILFFLFLSKGIGEPYSKLSTAIYSSSLFSFFRDPSRFYSMIILGISLIFVHGRIQSKRVAGLFGFIVALWFIPTLVGLTHQTAKSFIFQAIPQYHVKVSAEPGRFLFYPQNIPMSAFNWYKGVSTGSNNNPTLALLPLPHNQGTFSGFMDTYFNQLSAYSSQSLSTGTPSAHLLTKLQISTVIQDNRVLPDYQNTIIHNDQILTSDPSFNVSAIHDGVQTYTRNKSSTFIVDEVPLFVVGDLRTFDLVSRQTSRPLILLNQPHNIKEFLRLKPHQQTIVYEKLDDMHNLFLDSMDKHSLHVEKIVWNNDTEWSLHEAGLQINVLRGLLHTSGRSIEPKTASSTLTIPITSKPGKYVIASRYSQPDTQSSISLRIGTHTLNIPANENSHFQWFISQPILIQTKDSVQVSVHNSRQVVIDDIILIPEKVFKSQRNAFSKILKQNTIVDIQNAHSLSSDSMTDTTTFHQRSHDTWDVQTDSPWITFHMPFDYGWNIQNQIGVFVGDYYGMTFLTDTKSQKSIYYKHEEMFITFRNISITTAFLCVIYIMLDTFLNYRKKRL